MSFSTTDNIIKAGTLDLLLIETDLNTSSTNNPHNVANQQEWIPFNRTQWTPLDSDKRTADLIKQLQSNSKIQATCHHNINQSFLRIRIYVVPTRDSLVSDYYDWRTTNYTASSFLELMLLLDRRPDLFSDTYLNSYPNYIQKSTLSPFQQNLHSSLLDMFVRMPSPKPAELPSDTEPVVKEFLVKVADLDTPFGMKTTLYQYQKASMLKMLQRELAPTFVHRPTVVELLSVDSVTYYHDQLTGISTETPGLQKDVAGGIICEDMGTGKTCICLALIMASKRILPPLHDIIIKTDFLENYNAGKSSSISLRNIAAIQTMIHSVDWRPFRYQLPSEMVNAFECSSPYYEWTSAKDQPLLDRPHRREIKVPTLKVHLSSATLVVVPDNLVAQWTGEIYKHIHDGQLDFLVLDKREEPIPDPFRLVQLDLMLISQSRFSHENSSGGFDFQGIPRKCHCPYIGSTRERNCSCAITLDKPEYTSPLLQVHWKRVIVDEGHSLSARHSRQSILSSKLFSCWNWICTGTPTQNLTEAAAVRTRQEGVADDLARLGVLLGDILKLQPYASKKKLWPQSVVKPFIKGKIWARNNINNLMCRTMIRNQRNSIENEVVLPPLYCKTVELDFDYYQWLAHNCQISMISLNAILSEREGPDYLFTKNNHKALRETVSNLRQSCTWHSIDLTALRSSHHNCVQKIKNLDAGTTRLAGGDEDERDLRQLKDVFELALGDPMFMEMMTKHDVSFVVQGLPNLMKETWGWCAGSRGAYLPVSNDFQDDHCLVSGDIVVDLMRDVTNPKNTNKDLYVYDNTTKLLESTVIYEKRKKRNESAALKSKKGTSGESNPSATKRPPPGNDGTKKDALDLDSPDGMVDQIQPKMDIDGDNMDITTPPSIEREGNNEAPSLTFYTRGVFSDVRILCSTSSKINYLVDQILSHHTNEKCIIFSQHYNEMQEIFLALQLVKVRVLMYLHTSMSSVKRSQAIMTFNTSDNANVMIMAVQKAAYGIDLSSASRVYFCSPVWQAAMEQQAIKRAHRIGQNKPVFVEILVIRHSIEDALLKRRNVVAAHQDNSNVDFYADKRLQNILNHANIVAKPDHIHKSKEDNHYYQKISFLDKPIRLIPLASSSPLEGSVANLETTTKENQSNVTKEEADIDVDSHDGSPPMTKKRKVVRFNIED